MSRKLTLVAQSPELGTRPIQNSDSGGKTNHMKNPTGQNFGKSVMLSEKQQAFLAMFEASRSEREAENSLPGRFAFSAVNSAKAVPDGLGSSIEIRFKNFPTCSN